MLQKNVEITRRFVEDFNRRSVDALVDFYDPEIEYVEDPSFLKRRCIKAATPSCAKGESSSHLSRNIASRSKTCSALTTKSWASVTAHADS
jgi:hypothetical protein